MRTVISSLLLILIALPVTAHKANAQMEDPILSMPDGQVILNISATERRDVEQDLLVANLSYQATNKGPRALQDEVNKIMKEAISTAKKVDTVKVSTGSYQVYDYTDPRTKEKKWRASQSLTLKSKDAESLLKLSGKLQDMKLNMNGLSYMLDPKTSVSVQDSLMEDALKQLQMRANRAAKALGKSTAELRDVNVQTGGVPYQQIRNYGRSNMMEMQGAVADMAAPVAEAGETTISLSVSARAILKP